MHFKIIVTGIAIFIVAFFAGATYWGPEFTKVTYVPSDSNLATSTNTSSDNHSNREVVADNREVVKHVPMPRQVKAIYMTSCVAGTPSFREQLIDLAKTTEINSIMIDIKDYSGTLSFLPASAIWQPAWTASKCGARDMKGLIAQLHENGIYVIGRITVFQDPFAAERQPDLAVKRSDGVTIWKDHKGLAFIDVAAKNYWQQIVQLSADAYNVGFDELNFDYVRYPSDGNMRDIAFTHTNNSAWPGDKRANLEAFFSYLYEELNKEEHFSEFRHENTGRDKSVPYTSADLFGMTTTNYDDLSIGQIQERAAPYFDAIAPMVYPSHYPAGYLGIADPNTDPYRIVFHAMKSGVDRMQATTTRVDAFQHERVGTSTPAVYSKPAFGADRLRTWIQDFNYGGYYGPAEVRAQIQASYDAGVMDWMIWSPSNRYTRGALRPSGTYEVE